MRKLAILFAGIFCIIALGVNSVDAADTAKIGVVLPLTGPQASFGQIERLSFDMAVEEINSAGGINGKKLELIIEDDTGQPEVGRSVVEKLITKDKVLMIGGGYNSAVTYTVAALCQKNKIPFLVNTGAADKITTSGWDYIYRLSPPASHYADAIMTLLADIVKPKSVAILHENSLFGTKGAKSFEKGCKAAGYQVLLKQGYENVGIDFKPHLIRIKQLNPDIVYMVSSVEVTAMLMKQARELKLRPKMFIGAGAGFTQPEFAQNAGVASEKLISATLWHQVLPFPGAMAYHNKFVAKFNKPPGYYGAEAYAAAYVIADALKRTTSFTGTAIKQALSQTDLMTVFGPVKFVEWEKMKNQNKAATYVVQWIDGKLELVWPKNLATKGLVYPVDWFKTWGY